MTKEWVETGIHPKFFKYKGIIYHEDDFLNGFMDKHGDLSDQEFDREYKKAMEEAQPLTETEIKEIMEIWEKELGE